ncbi:MAG: hypothetical protein JST11_16965 [Acidobacteria bacterium]|nr:hypothetical protein [Acidobacteriota bacterium]
MTPLLRFAATLGLLAAAASAQIRWHVEPDGGIAWDVPRRAAHQDQIEMSGLRISAIVTYGVRDTGASTLTRQLVFPGLRTIPNDTHASLSYTFTDDTTPRVFVDGRPAREAVTRFRHRGMITIESMLGGVALVRTLFPSVDKPLYVERYVFTNRTDREVRVEVESTRHTVRTNASRGVTGEYVIVSEVPDTGEKAIQPGASAEFTLAFSAREAAAPPVPVDAAAEEAARRARVDSFLSKLRLETPDPVLNTAFAFAKIRTTESIYQTKGGLMHGPGGGAYYAAIWANDQAEYANPFFPFLGDATACEAAINSFRHFARYMNPDYKPIPSSIIAEGTAFWNGAGDRGDLAMISYGASRFALAYGDRKTARDLWPLVSWCLEYLKRKVTPQGAVASDSDELEGRFPAGKANLSTSSLYFDALNSAAMLGGELGRPAAELDDYRARAAAIRAAIESYFGANVQGFDTYRYYDGNTVLRAWICVPLAMGIFDRKQGTIAALFSPALWTPDGLATQSGEKTFWDRATLYGLRGALAAGETARAMEFLTQYSSRRLLGDHVPYPVEAWPEGNQRHLAAESALYCRIFTEGLFGIRPTGLRSFTATPRLPAAWDRMRLAGIHAFGGAFDLVVTRAGAQLQVDTVRAGRTVNSEKIAPGESVRVRFAE